MLWQAGQATFATCSAHVLQSAVVALQARQRREQLSTATHVLLRGSEHA